MENTLKRLIFILLITCITSGYTTVLAVDPTTGIESIDSLAMEKINDLSKYISVIGNKSTSIPEADKAIKRATQLFAEGSQFGVSSLNTEEITYFNVEEYFNRLLALSYDQVNIEWYDIHYVSDIQQMPDGNYVGVITIYQKFEGTKNDKIVYKDITKKDITVFVMEKKAQQAGELVSVWDVLLGDVMVSETMKE